MLVNTPHLPARHLLAVALCLGLAGVRAASLETTATPTAQEPSPTSVGARSAAAQAGDAAAQYALGLMYAHGDGLARDDALAAKWFAAAAAQGHAQAAYNLGVLTVNGRGVPRDYAAARGHFEQAAASVPSAAYNLGVLYDQGLGVAADAAQALTWYRKAADAG
ncbi:MAG TPA: hypothetical protein VGD25_10220, partial [Immundisolibacter sp.]